MPNPLFSSYRAGENRVTSSTLAVFERIDLALVAEILGAASDGAELTTITFANQPSGSGSSVPDARISARFTWWFETKTARGSYDRPGHSRRQLIGHSARLRDHREAWLFILTPDPIKPDWLAELAEVDESVRSRILWMGFRQLADAIEAIIGDAKRLIGEQSRFLLNELVALYDTDGLLTSDDTVIVAARVAWPEYLSTSAYVGQPNRAFRDGLTHFGFYTDGAIQRLVPRIRHRVPSVSFTRAEAAQQRAAGNTEVGDLIDALLTDGSRVDGESYCVLLLTSPDDPETVALPNEIGNDATAASGRRVAWTQATATPGWSGCAAGCERPVSCGPPEQGSPG